MKYTAVRLNELDKSNASKLEGNIDDIPFSELDKAKPTGLTIQSFKRELERGELFLTRSIPRTKYFEHLTEILKE